MPSGIYKHKPLTEEHKRKVTNWKNPIERGKKISNSLTGKKLSEEHKKRLSEAKKKLYENGYINHRKGKYHSEETKKRLSENHKGKYIGKDNHFYKNGKPKCQKCGKEIKGYTSKLCFDCFHKINRGEKHPNWQGGKSFEPYGLSWTDDLKESIRKRDNYVCQICEIHQDELTGMHKKLSVHHIDYCKDNLNPENLITLCTSCHMKTNYNHDYWIDFFKGQLLEFLSK